LTVVSSSCRWPLRGDGVRMRVSSGSSPHALDSIEGLRNSVVMSQVVQTLANWFNTMKIELRSLALGKYHVLCVVDDDAMRG
jgi:hypothetical protein